MYSPETPSRRSGFISNHAAFIVYLPLAMLFLGLQMFQGLSFLDIGFYVSGYRYFNDEPYTIYYLGQWLLTFGLSGYLCRILSADTFMALRVMHLVFIAASQTVIYLYLRRYIRSRHIIIGLSLATLAHFGSYTELNYNDYSVGLLTLAVIACHHGIMRGKGLAVLASGAFAGFAIFFRMVDITFLGIPFLVWLISLKWETEVGTARMFLCFFTGAVIATGFTLIILHACGMSDILVLTLRDLISIGGDTENSHSIKAVLLYTYELYKGEIQGFSVILLIASLMTAAEFRLRGIRLIAADSVLSLLIILHIYLWEAPSNITVGICLAALPLVFLHRHISPAVASLLVLSLFIPMIFPIGSNAGPHFYGKDICFLTLPVATAVIAGGMDMLPPRLRRPALRAATITYVFVCAAMVYTNIRRPMMEEGNRLQCLYSIDSRQTRGILTTKENADMYNYLIRTLRPVIPAGSYLICNFSIPVISILDCKPYAVFSAEFTTTKMNERYINTAYAHTGRLPYLLIDNYDKSVKFEQLERYLGTIYPYATVWQDGRYALKAPRGQQPMSTAR